MPLPKPSLDNRVFDQLVAEGRAQLPRLVPAWTDHNASDPGITLLELGAWLAEQNIYRFDRLSDEASRSFVRLAGIDLQPAGVAHTVVALDNDNPGVALPARLQLGRAELPLFESSEPLFASPARLVSVLVGRTSLLDVTAINDALTGFDAFGTRPRSGHALYLGFDRALDAPSHRLSLHLWTLHDGHDDLTRAALQREAAANPAPPCPPPDWRLHYSVRTVWEYHAGGNVWLPLNAVVDETRALSLSGFVRFDAPAGHKAGGPGRSAFFIRCRIQRNRFECPPRLLHVALNAVRAEHGLSQPEQSLGRSRGHAGTVFQLPATPVVAQSLSLRLTNGSSVQADWRAAPDWDRAGPHDHTVLLDAERGRLTGGNGLRGALLPAGFEVLARWQAGGGPDGNIAAGQLLTLPPTAANQALLPALAVPLRVRQPLAARGGSLAETLPQAQARAFEALADVDKAVTLDDIERLALATPGVPVARVRAAVGADPLLPCWPAPGVVTVIVIPSCPRPAPLPSRALLDAVERHLAPRRLITSEIHAIAPRYRRVGVQATLHVACDADADAVIPAAEACLAAFFDPLDGGPDGAGWPFGRSVYRSEVMALLAALPGIERISGLALLTGGSNADACGCAGGAAADEARCGNVDLCVHELVLPGRHRLQLAADSPRLFNRSLAHECHTA